jgi:signal transduction histidine kinase
VVDLLAYDDVEGATKVLLDEAIPAQDLVLSQLREMLELQQQAGRQEFEQARETYHQTKTFLGGIFAFALILGVIIAFVVVRRTNQAEQALLVAKETLEDRVKDRTQQLSGAYKELKNSQAQLVASEKMASLGQLTAGIAHEIKNPLNFIKNFSVTSVQLLVELREILHNLHAESVKTELSEECDELIGMLSSDLEKIKAHGERVDSIISGMLLHARGETGERLPTMLNELVDQTTELAFHGERARNRGFAIQIEKHLDPAAGKANLSPQDISRVLVNLANNAFYATASRREQNQDPDYKPTLTVTTKDLGDKVQIVIEDNGTGVPENVHDNLFTPFFSTKPTGQGTGLGLSLSYDIVVQQHHGSIELEDVDGGGARFIVTIPRENSGK